MIGHVFRWADFFYGHLSGTIVSAFYRTAAFFGKKSTKKGVFPGSHYNTYSLISSISKICDVCIVLVAWVTALRAHLRLSDK